MICLAYLSSASTPMDPPDLSQILGQARRNNVSRGVTGMLCHYEGSFLQFLEGDPDAVAEVFGRIRRDARHTGVLEVCRQPIGGRAFADWSMALAKADEVSAEQRAFCHGLRQVKIASDAAHRDAIEPFLHAFRAWMR